MHSTTIILSTPLIEVAPHGHLLAAIFILKVLG